MDRFLLDFFDRLTTKAQRRGYLLTTLHVHTTGVVLVSSVLMFVAGPLWFIPIAGGFWGCWLWGTIRWAEANKDYPESVKIMDRLNHRVLFNREHLWWLRLGWLALCLALFIPSAVSNLLLGAIADGLISLINILALTLLYYLDGCFFIGPGEFAKERRDVEIEIKDGITAGKNL